MRNLFGALCRPRDAASTFIYIYLHIYEYICKFSPTCRRCWQPASQALVRELEFACLCTNNAERKLKRQHHVAPFNRQTNFILPSKDACTFLLRPHCSHAATVYPQRSRKRCQHLPVAIKYGMNALGVVGFMENIYICHFLLLAFVFVEDIILRYMLYRSFSFVKQ